MPPDPVVPDGVRRRDGQARSTLGVLLVVLAVVAVAVVAMAPRGQGSMPGPTSKPGGSPVPSSSGSASIDGPYGVGSVGVVGSGPPSPGGDPILIGAGDVGICGSSADRQVGELIAGIPGTVFADGDLAYDSGTLRQFTDCFGTAWGSFKDRIRAVPGNHEWRTAGLAGYLGYFGSTVTGPDGATWYSFDLGAWHVVMLDANCTKIGGCGPSSKEGRWLEQDLSIATGDCTIAFWHQPRFSSGVHGNDATVAPFWKVLAAHHADVVVNGHDHDYERFAPQDPNGVADPTNGIREFVVGTGGAPLRGFNQAERTSEFRQSYAHGALELVLHRTGYDWRFIAVDGTVLDAGSGTCH